MGNKIGPYLKFREVISPSLVGINNIGGESSHLNCLTEFVAPFKSRYLQNANLHVSGVTATAWILCFNPYGRQAVKQGCLRFVVCSALAQALLETSRIRRCQISMAVPTWFRILYLRTLLYSFPSRRVFVL